MKAKQLPVLCAYVCMRQMRVKERVNTAEAVSHFLLDVTVHDTGAEQCLDAYTHITHENKHIKHKNRKKITKSTKQTKAQRKQNNIQRIGLARHPNRSYFQLTVASAIVR